MRHGVQWVETWIDAPSAGEYVLVVRGLDDGHVEIRDPHRGGEVVETFKSYADARAWLNEEEFDPVKGRIAYDDGAATTMASTDDVRP